MQVTVEDISSVKKTLRIEIPREEVAREIENAYDQLRKTAKIKGFRPGKTPRSVLERMFKKDVLADVSSRLIQTSFIDAIKQKELRVVGQPKLDPPALSGPGDPMPQAVMSDIEMALGGGMSVVEPRSAGPSWPKRANLLTSVRMPPTASWLILKSPVWITIPRGVLKATPIPPTTLWQTSMNSSWKAPSRSGAALETVSRRVA